MFGSLHSGTWGFVQAKPEAPELLGLSPVIWLILGGGAVLATFVAWENRRLTRGDGALLDPAMLRIPVLTGGLTSFFFQYFLQAGMFFAGSMLLAELGIGASMSVLAIIALVALAFTRRIPTTQPGACP